MVLCITFENIFGGGGVGRQIFSVITSWKFSLWNFPKCKITCCLKNEKRNEIFDNLEKVNRSSELLLKVLLMRPCLGELITVLSPRSAHHWFYSDQLRAARLLQAHPAHQPNLPKSKQGRIQFWKIQRNNQYPQLSTDKWGLIDSFEVLLNS